MQSAERSSLISKFESIHPVDIKARAAQPDFDILHVPLGLDLKDLQRRLEKALTTFPWHTKDSLAGYRALGLQYSDQNLMYTDAIEATSDYERREGEELPRMSLRRPFRMYEKINPAGQLFGHLFTRIEPTMLFRSRLLIAEAGFIMSNAHIDGDVSVRLHIPIETNPEAWFEIEGRRYHLPADGSAYLVNTSRIHRIGNPGETRRSHIVSVVYGRFPDHLHRLIKSALIHFIEIPMKGLKRNLDQQSSIAMERAQNRCEACGEQRTLYGVPASQSHLKALCAPCIEDVGRELETELRSSGLSEPGLSEKDALFDAVAARINSHSRLAPTRA